MPSTQVYAIVRIQGVLNNNEVLCHFEINAFDIQRRNARFPFHFHGSEFVSLCTTMGFFLDKNMKMEIEHLKEM